MNCPAAESAPKLSKYVFRFFVSTPGHGMFAAIRQRTITPAVKKILFLSSLILNAFKNAENILAVPLLKSQTVSGRNDFALNPVFLEKEEVQTQTSGNRIAS